ncbi:MAG: hypothetical protein R3B90_23430 [Planctomycetaceae bacterium]
MKRLLFLLLVTWSLAAGSQSVSAEGLLWSLPPVGKWIRYEGTYTQVIKKPDEPGSDETLTWTRHLTIKAISMEDAVYQGQAVPCQWVEFKVVTGPVKEGIIDAGPGAIRIYKVLVPQSAVDAVTVEPDGTVLDVDRVIATHIPIVKGYRKIGNEEATEITTGVFQTYPALTLMPQYRQLSDQGQAAIAAVNDNVDCQHWRGTMVTEDNFTRSTNTTDLWRTESALVPFGVAQWLSQLTVESKGSTNTRGEFKVVSEVTEEMTAVVTGDDAESELVIE